MVDDGRDDASGADASRDRRRTRRRWRRFASSSSAATTRTSSSTASRAAASSSPRTLSGTRLYLRLKAGELALAERRRKPGGCAFCPASPPILRLASRRRVRRLLQPARPSARGEPLRPEARVERPGRRRRPRPPPRGESNPDGRGGARTQQTDLAQDRHPPPHEEDDQPAGGAAPGRPRPRTGHPSSPTRPFRLCATSGAPRGVSCSAPRARTRTSSRLDGDVETSSGSEERPRRRSWRRRTRGATRTPRAAARRATSGGDGREARPIDNLHFARARRQRLPRSSPRAEPGRGERALPRSVEPEETRVQAGRHAPVRGHARETVAAGGYRVLLLGRAPLAAEMQAIFLANEAFELCEETFRRCGEWFPVARRNEDAEGGADVRARGEGAEGGADVRARGEARRGRGGRSRPGRGRPTGSVRGPPAAAATAARPAPPISRRWQSHVEPDGDEDGRRRTTVMRAGRHPRGGWRPIRSSFPQNAIGARARRRCIAGRRDEGRRYGPPFERSTSNMASAEYGDYG